MEMGSRLRWGAIIAGIVLLLVGGIIGIVFIARNIFDNDNPTTTLSSEKEASLSDRNQPGVRFNMEIQGPIVAKEEHTAYRLSVSRTERVAQLIRGYDGFIEQEQRLDNTDDAFLAFITALERAGFDRTEGSDEEKDQGACSTGKKYIFTIEDEGVEVFRSWKTSCGDGIGNSVAPRSVRNLFTRQFPDLSDLIRGTGLSSIN